ncbi:hypothetical protein [Massilia sp. BHUDP2]|uniref:hypothetical protein n=1 Tax=Massilia sp. BHUDP2 TaxID=3034505 RepID=UPI003905F720
MVIILRQIEASLTSNRWRLWRATLKKCYALLQHFDALNKFAHVKCHGACDYQADNCHQNLLNEEVVRHPGVPHCL